MNGSPLGRADPGSTSAAPGSTSAAARWLASGVLVIGGGPAGVAAALRLHDRGIRALLVDRAAFPRAKLCGGCLNLAALAGLRTLGCDHLIGDLAAPPLDRWQLRTAQQVIEAPLPGGVALSRWRLDAALITEAIGRGIEFRPECEAKILSVDATGVQVRLTNDRQPQRFAAAILASGISGGGVSRWLPWTHPPGGPIGAGTTLPEMAGVPAGTIQIAWDPAGYVGLVRLEDGRVDLAAALRGPWQPDRAAGVSPVGGRAALLAAIQGILHRTGGGSLPPLDPATLLTTPPLQRRRRVGHGRLLAAGDAAGYVEPFTGEGMAWALSTGIAAADCLAQADEATDCGAAWAARYRTLMRRRQWICRLLSHSLASPVRARWLCRAMTAAPWSVRYAIDRLNRAT